MEPQFVVRIGSQEMQRIFAIRKNLDFCHTLATYAEHYRQLGWSPLVRRAGCGTEVPVDFRRPHRSWARSLMELGLTGAVLELAVPLRAASLFVVRLTGPPQGALAFYLAGRQHQCIARAGEAEQHFFVLPPGWCVEPAGAPPQGEGPWSVPGTDGWAPLPPSRDESAQDSWSWLTPPWERPPGYPGPELLAFLEAQGVLRPETEEDDEAQPWWQEPAHAAEGPAEPRPEERSAGEEALLQAQVRELTALAQAMEKQLSVLQQPPAPEAKPAAEPLPVWWQEWSALLPRGALPPEIVAEFQDAVRAVCREHPQLAARREHVNMVVYCYQNYVRINPHFAGLSYGEKLSQAVRLARDFLKS
ncbi:MAG: hypothetical protein FJ128_06345 [Deltaproteobacteria bacterium]|nr:hypothetical protein [Deltaproteobacteria bacterium]